MKYLPTGRKKKSNSEIFPKHLGRFLVCACVSFFPSNSGEKLQGEVTLSQHLSHVKWILTAGFCGQVVLLQLTIRCFFQASLDSQLTGYRPQPLSQAVYSASQATQFLNGAETGRLFLIKFGSGIFSL